MQVLGSRKLNPEAQVKHSNSVLPLQVAHLELHSEFKNCKLTVTLTSIFIVRTETRLSTGA